MVDTIRLFFVNIFQSFGNLFHALTHPGEWLNFSDPEAVMRLVYYGASHEFFFAIFVLLAILTAIGMWRRPVMWAVVRGLEGFANTVGRFFAWAGLIMVFQQIVIVFLQRIFRVSAIEFGPLGYAFGKDLSWWSEELKLYNAMIVALCISYTFVQGGHVRVDLVYSRLSFRARRIVDMFGALVFMMPVAVFTWIYAWFFFWRVMIVPKPSASDKLEALLMKSKALRWNVETIGFSPNGFNAYFLFKVLILFYVALVFLQAYAFFCRSYLEYVEGPESEGRYADRDTLGDGEKTFEGTH